MNAATNYRHHLPISREIANEDNKMFDFAEGMPETEFKIPKAFIEDHARRALATGWLVKETKTHFIMSMTEDEWQDVLGDAEFYADAQYIIGAMGNEFLGLSSSARATAKAIRKQIGGGN
jgi:hypothetical protein